MVFWSSWLVMMAVPWLSEEGVIGEVEALGRRRARWREGTTTGSVAGIDEQQAVVAAVGDEEIPIEGRAGSDGLLGA